MGRHSIPGPDDPADDDALRRFGYGAEPPEAEEPADDEPPTRALPTTGSQRTWDSGEWTGSHRAITPGRRSRASS